MKKILLASLILSLAGAALWAQNAPQGTPFAPESVTLSGKATVAENGFVTLASGGKTYTLMYPRAAVMTLPVKTGDTITATGYRVPGPRWADENALFIRVTQLEAGGKTYVFSGSGFGPGGGWGRGRGGAGCFGGGRGPMMGGGRW